MVEAGVHVRGEHFAELVDDCLVGVGLIQPEYGLEADRLEIAFLLRLLQRVGVDELPIDAAAILTKRSGGKLDYRNGRLVLGDDDCYDY